MPTLDIFHILEFAILVITALSAAFMGLSIPRIRSMLQTMELKILSEMKTQYLGIELATLKFSHVNERFDQMHGEFMELLKRMDQFEHDCIEKRKLLVSAMSAKNAGMSVEN